ncbi:hypothetical protein GGP41_001063 [Bipolaris sorokiniana]|uniref:Uncharacterized protein n=1 Tax=Cochliobolus sativus TaxID=45130 RepID=A0A8H6DQS6_COCSA|nr:hypothetical protein GGP41_001063 [Bipolaris sorokiniana]
MRIDRFLGQGFKTTKPDTGRYSSDAEIFYMRDLTLCDNIQTRSVFIHKTTRDTAARCMGEDNDGAANADPHLRLHTYEASCLLSNNIQG